MPATRPYLSTAFALVILSLSGPATAQAPTRVLGRVLEFNSETPVASATVELLDGRQRRVSRTSSDANGQLQFERVVEGSYQLRVASIGYREVTTPGVDVPAGETVTLIVRIAIDAVPLAPLEVLSRPARLHHNVAIAEFMERSRSRMGGTFFMRDQIDAQQPRHTSDLLRQVGSFSVIDSGSSTRTGAVHNARTQCQPTVYVDGRIVFAIAGIGSYGSAYEAMNSVHWSELEGLEVYAGAATLPAQFSGSRGGCGVIALWTRR